MRNRWWWMLILVVVAFLTLTRWTGAKPSAKVTWEYTVISVYGPSATTPPPNTLQLNNAGAQGWELVAVRSGNFPNADSKEIRIDYYFKR